MKKIVVTDLDGTLLNSHHEISKKNVEALHLVQDRGVELVIATGRTYANARDICEKASLNAHIISSNGSFVHLKDGKKLKARTLGKRSIQYALHWLNDNGYYYEISTEFKVYRCSKSREVLEVDFNKARRTDAKLGSGALEEMWESLQTNISISQENTIGNFLKDDFDYGKILSISFDKNKLFRGREYFRRQQDVSLVVSHPLNFELMNSNVSKGNALAYLADHLGVPLSNVMVIGDSYNDISMFEKAGISVAMGNAEEDIRKHCDYISLSNDQHGVAQALRQYHRFFG